MELGGVWGHFWKIEHLSCYQNFIFDDKRLKYKYIVDSKPLITFLQKYVKKWFQAGFRAGIRGSLGRGFLEKLNIYDFDKSLYYPKVLINYRVSRST